MKMATSLNEANLEKRLLTLTNTQESIQTLSLWCLHHKSHCKKIIDIWMKVLKKVKINHRLTLFYLANDVIQNGKRKGCAQFAEMWMPVIKHAVVLVRDEKIRPQIDRILTVWNDRSIFDAQYINELHTILGKSAASKVQAVVNAKILAEFKPQKLVDKIKKFKKLESDVELKHKQFCSLKMDVCSSETLKQLKDKAHGTKFTKEFEDATTKLEELIHLLQREVKERSSLLELLEQSELFYETQKKEAKIVANAYKNFGTRVKNLQTKLQEVIPNLPSPVPTPTLDAPSPVDSSSGESPTKDDSKTMKVNNRASLQGKDSKNMKASVDDSKDNTEAVDMEMSDDDCDPAVGKDGSAPCADVPSPGSAPSPEGSPIGLNLSPPHVRKAHSKETIPTTKAFSNVTQIPTITKRNSVSATSLFDGISTSGTQTKTNASSLDIRLSNLMQNIPNFTTNFFQGRPLEGINSIHGAGSATGTHNEGCSTPVKDEESATGSATPLQDENREASYGSQPLKEGSATPTIGDILQKLVSTGSVHNLNAQSNVSGQSWSLQSSQQSWYSQSSPSQPLKVKPLAPPPAPLFTNLVPTIPLPSSSQSFSDEIPSNSSSSALGSFAPSSVNVDVGDAVGKMRSSKPGQVYRRNSNIVELTPSPGATPNFDGSHDACKNNNLITLVQNCDSENSNQAISDAQSLSETSFAASIKTRAASSQSIRYAGSSSVGSNRSIMTANLLTVSNNNGESQPYVAGESVSSLVDNSNVSNLRTIVPLVPYVMDDAIEGKAEKAPSLVESGNNLAPLGAQTSYSKIETLDSRRDSSANMWSSNMGSVFAGQNESMPSGWKPMAQVTSSPFRRETPPYGTVRGFSFQRRGGGGGVRRDWNPANVGPPPKRLMLAPTTIRPPRWSHNPPPY